MSIGRDAVPRRRQLAHRLGDVAGQYLDRRRGPRPARADKPRLLRLRHAGQQDVKPLLPEIFREARAHALLVLLHQDLDAVVLLERPRQAGIQRRQIAEGVGHRRHG